MMDEMQGAPFPAPLAFSIGFATSVPDQGAENRGGTTLIHFQNCVRQDLAITRVSQCEAEKKTKG
jgi:hypothetical protein